MNAETYVKKSVYRLRVIKSLDGNVVKIPSEIAKDAGTHTSSISKTLRELREHDIIECINPHMRKGRLYRLTEKGKKVAQKIN